MNRKQLILGFWDVVIAQKADSIRSFFLPDVTIRWHNTNEQFSVEEFIVANCEYPDCWEGKVERIEVVAEDLVISVTRVWPVGRQNESHHAVSFFQLSGGKILCLDEYWGEDGPAPQWRQAK